MKNNIFVGIVKEKSEKEEFKYIKRCVLYKDSDKLYTELDSNTTYKTDDEIVEYKDRVIDRESLVECDIFDYKKDYSYLLQRHLDSDICMYKSSKKDKIRSLFKKS